MIRVTCARVAAAAASSRRGAGRARGGGCAAPRRRSRRRAGRAAASAGDEHLERARTAARSSPVASAGLHGLRRAAHELALARARPHSTRDAVRGGVRLGARLTGSITTCTTPRAVAQVEEDQPAVVAVAADEAGERRRARRRAAARLAAARRPIPLTRPLLSMTAARGRPAATARVRCRRCVAEQHHTGAPTPRARTEATSRAPEPFGVPRAAPSAAAGEIGLAAHAGEPQLVERPRARAGAPPARRSGEQSSRRGRAASARGPAPRARARCDRCRPRSPTPGVALAADGSRRGRRSARRRRSVDWRAESAADLTPRRCACSSRARARASARRGRRRRAASRKARTAAKCSARLGDRWSVICGAPASTSAAIALVLGVEGAQRVDVAQPQRRRPRARRACASRNATQRRRGRRGARRGVADAS